MHDDWSLAPILFQERKDQNRIGSFSTMPTVAWKFVTTVKALKRPSLHWITFASFLKGMRCKFGHRIDSLSQSHAYKPSCCQWRKNNLTSLESWKQLLQRKRMNSASFFRFSSSTRRPFYKGGASTRKLLMSFWNSLRWLYLFPFRSRWRFV